MSAVSGRRVSVRAVGRAGSQALLLRFEEAAAASLLRAFLAFLRR